MAGIYCVFNGRHFSAYYIISSLLFYVLSLLLSFSPPSPHSSLFSLNTDLLHTSGLFFCLYITHFLGTQYSMFLSSLVTHPYDKYSTFMFTVHTSSEFQLYPMAYKCLQLSFVTESFGPCCTQKQTSFPIEYVPSPINSQ